MSFDVAAEAYDRLIGAWSRQLSPQLIEFAGVRAGQRVLDVGCGPGALTAELASRLGTDNVAAVDPSEPFVAAARSRHPGVDVKRASAEALPHSDGEFDAALAQLVVHFMTDPVVGLGEMRRVTREGGVVAACVWDAHGDNHPLGPFWQAARSIDPELADESRRAGTGEGQLVALLEAAGLSDVEQTVLTARRQFSGFDDWWEPLTMGVGPAGTFVAGLDETRQAQLAELCRSMLPPGAFTHTARAWAARGTA